MNKIRMILLILISQFFQISVAGQLPISPPINGLKGHLDKELNFYLSNDSGTIVINKLDSSGKRQGLWVQEISLQQKWTALNNIPDERRFNDINSFKKTIVNTKLYSDRSTYRDSDLIVIILQEGLYNRVNESGKKEGKWIEEYWFGYLIGSYSNGLKKDLWEFIPAFVGFNDDRFLKVLVIFKNEIRMAQVHGKIQPAILWKDYHPEAHRYVGYYRNNQKTGEWLECHKNTISRLIIYSSGIFHSSYLVIDSDTGNRKIESIVQGDNADTLVKYSYNLRWEKSKEFTYHILELPFRFRSEETSLQKVVGKEFYPNFRGLGLDKTKIELANGETTLEFSRNNELLFTTNDSYSSKDDFPCTFLSGSYSEYKEYFKQGSYLPGPYDLIPGSFDYR